ncbi:MULTISPECIES: DUF3592 domain-containing protein [unclassified Nostoc]|uniref:DUF3592 domain-containing protein n=1 Tax=unclassified Nostoc TaxID=2593658 RepID=UPI002AD28E5A|nr:DUF3592 domain-containing protein [Nostoc sp. DedQUE03]MDZ7971148.1 DUF3592 domain-containing protein [Nostoc sp. DedQUE03]MDZ8046603.1 DUF3592 domain-containing protein [Nostoc sp. DedQUE02]
MPNEIYCSAIAKPMNFKPHQITFDDKLSAGIGLVIGLLFIGGGFWVRNIIAREGATLNETRGTVIDSISRRESNSTNNEQKETYAPVIEFLANGERTRFTGYYESYRSSNGQIVVVRYDPKQPISTARVVNPLEGLVPWGMFGMGGLAVVSSVGALLPVRWSSGG